MLSYRPNNSTPQQTSSDCRYKRRQTCRVPPTGFLPRPLQSDLCSPRCPNLRSQTPLISPGVPMASMLSRQRVPRGCASVTVIRSGTTPAPCCTNGTWRLVRSCGRSAGSRSPTAASLNVASSTRRPRASWEPRSPPPRRRTARPH